MNEGSAGRHPAGIPFFSCKAMKMEQKTSVRMNSIVKVYPNGVLANDRVSFVVREGEIHALVGENGAGKTTLMKILFGIEQPTQGTIEIYGNKVSIHSVAEAMQLGLGMVQQHFMLVPSMSVAENIVLGAEPVKRVQLDHREAVRLTKELCDRYRFNIDVNAKVADLSVGDKQKVEILKVLYREAKVIILDEPTAVLTPQETEELFKQLIVLKEHGHTVVFISHKLREVEAICDRITIMRKGRTVGVFSMSDMTIEKISRHMIGSDVSTHFEKKAASPGDVLLELADVSWFNEDRHVVVNNISFSLRSGEILSIVGVEGNGQRELVSMITGTLRPHTGSIRLRGKPLAGLSIDSIRRQSLAYIPQERMSVGVSLESTITENLSSVIYRDRENRRGILVNWKKLGARARDLVRDFTILTDSEKQKISMLSGGNIQKVVVAREFIGEPSVVVAEQPTRGVDVGAANLIHSRLVKLRDKGSGILLISSDLNEVMKISDSIIVMYDGEIAAYFPDIEGLTENELGFYMLGVKKQQEEEIRRCAYAKA